MEKLSKFLFQFSFLYFYCFYQIWTFVINQVPCVSSCWKEKTHTRVMYILIYAFIIYCCNWHMFYFRCRCPFHMCFGICRLVKTSFYRKAFWSARNTTFGIQPGYISRLACSKLLLLTPCLTQLKKFKSACVNNYENSSPPVPVLAWTPSPWTNQKTFTTI